MLTPNPRGNFHFIPGGPVFSSAVLADPGFAIVHATFLNPPPVAKGFDLIAEHLQKQGRPTQAVCSIQLRMPRALPSEEFGAFNREHYFPSLEKHDLYVDGATPMTRSNLGVEVNPPTQGVLYAFGFTVPTSGGATPRDFVLSGATDSGHDHKVVREGETSEDAMREKSAFVIGELGGRLKELQVSWDDCTAVNVYTVHNPFAHLREVFLEPLGRAQWQGLRWYYMRPPIVGLEVEVDARRTLQEIYLP